MTEPVRTFAVASDEAIVQLVRRAHSRLVVIAPALSKAVAEAVVRRFDDLGPLDIALILDSDPEVYRLGFGDRDALEIVRTASARSHFDLREQPGVRIGVVISDDTTMVFAPVSQNIEAGSTSVEKPNAIVLSGAADQIAGAAGADMSENAPVPEIGQRALEPGKVQEMQADLKSNPPKPFDITRKLNVFSSKVQYVEFSASNYRLTTRQIPLPPELVDVKDDDLKTRISGRIRAPFDDIGKVQISLDEDGKAKPIQVDDAWLKAERTRIEREYTYQVNNFGRVILYNQREGFDQATARFKLIVEKYQAALKAKLRESEAAFRKQILEEYLPKWQQNPPKHFAKWDIKPTPEGIKAELERLADEIFTNAITFEEPQVKVLYKNVAPENLRDGAFLHTLKEIMTRRRVPPAIINSLFESGQAAPVSGTFRGM